jgi:4-hydroxy-tetrahydrodipicolinate reductase
LSDSLELHVACVGALGRMGERVRAVLDARTDARLAGALEASDHPGLGQSLSGGVRVVADPRQAFSEANAVIDFTIPRATLAALPAAVERGIAYVCGTTGFRPEQRAELDAAARRIPIVLAPNFSVSVNVLVHLVREAARLLGDGYDAEIVELHHGMKRDAPSGTALRLAESVAAARGVRLDDVLVATRHGDTGVRPPGAIGVQTLRGGDNPGEHTVYLLGQGERLELSHRSATRDHFAAGAIRAALWLRGREPGLYGIEQVLGL